MPQLRDRDQVKLDKVLLLILTSAVSRDEAFLDLSLEIEENSSITSCLRNFSGEVMVKKKKRKDVKRGTGIETLNKQDKFYCEKCCSLQEAHKSIRVKRTPNILALHLLDSPLSCLVTPHSHGLQEKIQVRRVCRQIEEVVASRRLSSGAQSENFPLTIRTAEMCQLNNTTDAAADEDAFFNLFAVVVHVGSGMNHGHYVCLIKIHDQWFHFDDDTVEGVDDSHVTPPPRLPPPFLPLTLPFAVLCLSSFNFLITLFQLHSVFGSAQEGGGNYSGYILFYQKEEYKGEGSRAEAGRRERDEERRAKRNEEEGGEEGRRVSHRLHNKPL
eukprot:748391-Hanusia_phi.AAC.1